jgi:PRTRC genetic system protein C
MAITVQPITRKFRIGMQLIDDPCPGQSVETAVRLLAVAHPEVTTAAMSQPEIENGHEVFSFEKSIGTKG